MTTTTKLEAGSTHTIKLDSTDQAVATLAAQMKFTFTAQSIKKNENVFKCIY